jgi:chromosome segregation ATPase
MSSSTEAVSALKRKLNQNWNELGGATTNTNNNNNNPSSSSSTTITTPNDNLIIDEEGTDLDKVSRQLASQMGYNNELLQQIQDLETAQLAYQKDSAEKKIALRQAYGVCESLRSDMMDLKRKLTTMQETQDRALEEANRARVEAGIKAREAEACIKFVEEAKETISQLKNERDDAKRDAERAVRDQKQMREELGAMKNEEQVRAAERRADLDSAMRELAQMKSRIGPLEAELKAERARAAELVDAVRTCSEENQNLKTALVEARSQTSSYNDAVSSRARLEREFMEEAENKQKALQQAEAQVHSARELVNATENELRDMKKKYVQALNEKKEAENDCEVLKQQLEAVGNDLHTQTLARKSDRERLEGKIHSLQSELESLNAETRAHERAMAEEAANREQDFVEQRRGLEDAKSKLQNENQRLNELLQGMQREHTIQREDFQKERDAYEERLADAIRRQRLAEAALNSRDAVTNEENAKLREKLVDAQQTLNQRTRLHVEALGALESTIHNLATECHRLQAAHDGMLDEITSLRSRIKEYDTAGRGMIEEWHAETRRAMASLAESLDQAVADERAAREAQFAAESQRDNERSKMFILQEERARLEEELHALEEHGRTVDVAAAERTRAARLEADAAVSARAELESLTRRLQDQLERANSQNRSLQEDVDRAGTTLSESQAKARDRISTLEDRLAASQAELVKLGADKDAAVAEHGVMKKRLEASMSQVAALQKEVEELESLRRSAGIKDNKELVEYQRKFTLLSENMRKQSTQLTQTKNLLQVVQEQRKHLQEDNLALRAELDELLSRSLVGGGGGNHGNLTGGGSGGGMIMDALPSQQQQQQPFPSRGLEPMRQVSGASIKSVPLTGLEELVEDVEPVMFHGGSSSSLLNAASSSSGGGDGVSNNNNNNTDEAPPQSPAQKSTNDEDDL